MEIQGKIIVLNDTETIGAKGFQKRLLVVQTDEQYPQTIPVEFTQDKTTILNFYKVGDLVKIGINLRGSEWQGRYFANIQGWKIDKLDSTSLTAQQQMPDREATQPINNALPQNEAADDLPF
jgi:spore germination protein YaaH